MANTGYTRIDFEDKIEDSHGAVTIGASWKFTAPKAATYLICSKLLYGSALYADGNSIDTQSVSTVATDALDYRVIYGTPTSFQGSNGCTTFRLSAGNNVYINAGNSRTAGATALHTDGAHNYIVITSVD